MYIDYGTHIMLDLETMGTSPDAAIVSIGAVEMDFQNFKTGSTFYRAVRLESSMRGGGVVDGTTIMWWLEQNDSARLELCYNAVYIGEALEDFEVFLRSSCTQSGYDTSNVFVWGNGAAFDNVVLRRAYERINKRVPWRYRNDRCFRTLLAMTPIELQKEWGAQLVAHHALEDATAQANMLLKIFKQDGAHGTD